jgi:hypothetical protein
MSPSKKPQVDQINKSYSVEISGTDFDLMIEAARIEAARVLKVNADRLFVTTHSPLQPVTYTPFRANLNVPARPEKFSMRVTFEIKKDEDTDE